MGGNVWCGDPALTGSFAQNPCLLLPSPWTPGAQFAAIINNWWKYQFLPALQDMTGQLYAYRIFETAQLGHMMDAQDVNKAARVEQEQRVTSLQGSLPKEEVCVAASAPPVLSQTNLTATALTKGFKQDLELRAQDIVEGETAPYTSPSLTPATDRDARWTEYCTEFYDPQSNAGQGACPNASTAGVIVNGDISIEGFLLKDTINMNNPDEYATAKALLRNLVQPHIDERLPDNVVNTPIGEEHIIRQQHLDAITNVAADVVGSIISRRASLPSTAANTGALIQAIRTQAGIPACASSPTVGPCASTTPSYNETMLAMTKERFFDPQYFVRLQNSTGSLKQEQASVDAYTTIVLQDIYKLQEQINALLAARASLRLISDVNGSQTPATPLSNPQQAPGG